MDTNDDSDKGMVSHRNRSVGKEDWLAKRRRRMLHGVGAYKHKHIKLTDVCVHQLHPLHTKLL